MNLLQRWLWQPRSVVSLPIKCFRDKTVSQECAHPFVMLLIFLNQLIGRNRNCIASQIPVITGKCVLSDDNTNCLNQGWYIWSRLRLWKRVKITPNKRKHFWDGEISRYYLNTIYEDMFKYTNILSLIRPCDVTWRQRTWSTLACYQRPSIPHLGQV